MKKYHEQEYHKFLIIHNECMYLRIKNNKIHAYNVKILNQGLSLMNKQSNKWLSLSEEVLEKTELKTVIGDNLQKMS